MSTQPPARAFGPAPGTPAATPAPRLRRSREDRLIGGVCGGLGRYLGIDPVLLRVAVVALALSGGAGVLAYLLAWIVIPQADAAEQAAPAAGAGSAGFAAGAVLMLLGAVLLVRQIVPWAEWAVVWPVLLLAVGVLVLISALRSGTR
jgi:phage shock protein C